MTGSSFFLPKIRDGTPPRADTPAPGDLPVKKSFSRLLRDLFPSPKRRLRRHTFVDRVHRDTSVWAPVKSHTVLEDTVTSSRPPTSLVDENGIPVQMPLSPIIEEPSSFDDDTFSVYQVPRRRPLTYVNRATQTEQPAPGPCRCQTLRRSFSRNSLRRASRESHASTLSTTSTPPRPRTPADFEMLPVQGHTPITNNMGRREPCSSPSVQSFIMHSSPPSMAAECVRIAESDGDDQHDDNNTSYSDDVALYRSQALAGNTQRRVSGLALYLDTISSSSSSAHNSPTTATNRQEISGNSASLNNNNNNNNATSTMYNSIYSRKNRPNFLLSPTSLHASSPLSSPVPSESTISPALSPRGAKSHSLSPSLLPCDISPSLPRSLRRVESAEFSNISALSLPSSTLPTATRNSSTASTLVWSPHQLSCIPEDDEWRLSAGSRRTAEKPASIIFSISSSSSSVCEGVEPQAERYPEAADDVDDEHNNMNNYGEDDSYTEAHKNKDVGGDQCSENEDEDEDEDEEDNDEDEDVDDSTFTTAVATVLPLSSTSVPNTSANTSFSSTISTTSVAARSVSACSTSSNASTATTIVAMRPTVVSISSHHSQLPPISGLESKATTISSEPTAPARRLSMPPPHSKTTLLLPDDIVGTLVCPKGSYKSSTLPRRQSSVSSSSSITRSPLGSLPAAFVPVSVARVHATPRATNAMSNVRTAVPRDSLDEVLARLYINGTKKRHSTWRRRGSQRHRYTPSNGSDTSAILENGSNNDNGIRRWVLARTRSSSRRAPSPLPSISLEPTRNPRWSM